MASWQQRGVERMEALESSCLAGVYRAPAVLWAPFCWDQRSSAQAGFMTVWYGDKTLNFFKQKQQKNHNSLQKQGPSIQIHTVLKIKNVVIYEWRAT